MQHAGEMTPAGPAAPLAGRVGRAVVAACGVIVLGALLDAGATVSAPIVVVSLVCGLAIGRIWALAVPVVAVVASSVIAPAALSSSDWPEVVCVAAVFSGVAIRRTIGVVSRLSRRRPRS